MTIKREDVNHFLFDCSLFGFAEGAVAGAAAGVVVETALYPIDTIKTRLQAGSNSDNYLYIM